MSYFRCPYARIQEHTDIMPVAEVNIFDLQLLAQQISSKVQQWLPSLDIALRTDIATCFGSFPEMNLEGEWWDNPNGPVWLWWLIAILPLRTEIQVPIRSSHMLSWGRVDVHMTKHLYFFLIDLGGNYVTLLITHQFGDRAEHCISFKVQDVCHG